MSKDQLHYRLQCLQKDGLSPTLLAMIENVIVFRKWGTLGGYREAKEILLERIRKAQPDHLPDARKLINEA